MKVTAIILTKNEEFHMKRVIRSLRDIVSEILVIDDGSEDKTVSVAKELGAKVIKQELKNDFAAQRNAADRHAKSEWILHIDADEELTPELAKEIAGLSEDDYFAYYLKRRDYFWGTELKYGELATARNTGFIRLYKKGSGSWKGTVHETFETNAETRQLGEFLNHFPHQTVADFLVSVNRYSTLRAQELLGQGVKANLITLVFFPIGKFKYTYFLKRGFLDGPAGFVYAFMMSFHSFLVRAKLYQYTNLSS